LFFREDDDVWYMSTFGKCGENEQIQLSFIIYINLCTASTIGCEEVKTFAITD